FNALSSVLQAMLGLILLLKVNIGIFVIALVLILFFDFNSKGNLSSSKFNIKIYKNEMIEGAKYIIHNDLLLRSAQLLLLINFFNSFQTVVVPIISTNFFNGPIFYGAFLTVTGIGGIFGNVLSPIIAKYLRPNQIIGIFLCMNAISWMLA
ncbi:TPA: MFS transporter, partial [Streptococcus suis]